MSDEPGSSGRRASASFFAAPKLDELVGSVDIQDAGSFSRLGYNPLANGGQGDVTLVTQEDIKA